MTETQFTNEEVAAAPMKAISLWQPWASAIAFGLKKIETRNWPAPSSDPSLHGRRIAIQATLFKPDTILAIDNDPVIRAELARKLEVPTYCNADGIAARLPYAKIVATCRVTGSVPTTHKSLDDLEPIEAAFGNFSPGRYAWMLEDVEPVDPPIEARGRQKLWYVDSEIAAELGRRGQA